MDPPVPSEEEASGQEDRTLPSGLSPPTLQGVEEEVRERQQLCGEQTLSEAAEDPGVGGLNPDSADCKTLQGIAPAVGGRLRPVEDTGCALVLTVGQERTVLVFGEGGTAAL